MNKQMTKTQILKEVYRMDPTLKEKGNEDSRDAVLLLLYGEGTK